MSRCQKSSPIIETAAAGPAAASGPPYAIPVAPLTSFYAGAPHTAFVTSDGGGECDLKIRDLVTGEVVSDGDRVDANGDPDDRPVVRVTGQKIHLRVDGDLPPDPQFEWHVPDPNGDRGGKNKSSRVFDYDLKWGSTAAGPQAPVLRTNLTENHLDDREVTFHWVDTIHLGERTVSVDVTSGEEGNDDARSAAVTFEFVGPELAGAAAGALAFHPEMGGEDDVFAETGNGRFGIPKYGRSRTGSEVPDRGMNVWADLLGPARPHGRDDVDLPSGKLAAVQRIRSKQGVRVERSSTARLLYARGPVSGVSSRPGQSGRLRHPGRLSLPERPVRQPAGPTPPDELAVGPHRAAGRGRLPTRTPRSPIRRSTDSMFPPRRASGVETDVRLRAKFDLFLMYCPNPNRSGGSSPDESVWVTVRKMRWGWEGAVSMPADRWPAPVCP